MARRETANSSSDLAVDEETHCNCIRSPGALEGAILSLGLDICKTDVPPSRLGQKEEADKHEVFADHQKNRSHVFAQHMVSPTLGSSTASRLVVSDTQPECVVVELRL